METIDNGSGLKNALVCYASALELIEKAEGNPSKNEFIEVLTARDTLHTRLSEGGEVADSASDIGKVVALDGRLKTQAEVLASAADLANLRQSFNPPKDAWWWAFEPAQTVSSWDKLDWLWNGLMAGSLALAASFMIQIFRALSVGGLSWGETFATIAQGAGLALIGSGALTDTGQQKVENILNGAGISPKFHSEVTCGLAFMLLIGAFSVHRHMPDYFYNKGNFLYEYSKLADAEMKYLQGLEVAPDDLRFNLALGQVYESMGALDRALEEYKKMAETGDLAGLNNIGRVYLFRFNPIERRRTPELAEAFLRLGLQRAKAAEKPDPNILYQLNRNLGWALLNQEKYQEAEVYLKRAVGLDQGIKGNQIGGGIAYCLLGHAYRALENMGKAEQNWTACMERARPETLLEYKWFMDVGQSKLADYINTSKIVGGLSDAKAEEELIINMT